MRLAALFLAVFCSASVVAQEPVTVTSTAAASVAVTPSAERVTTLLPRQAEPADADNAADPAQRNRDEAASDTVPAENGKPGGTTRPTATDTPAETTAAKIAEPGNTSARDADAGASDQAADLAGETGSANAALPATDDSSVADTPTDEPAEDSEVAASVVVKVVDEERQQLLSRLESFCKRIDQKLSSVSQDECMRIGLLDSGARSNNKTPLLFRDFLPAEGEPSARVLVVGGIHGDEYSSVSIIFKWLEMLGDERLGERFHWRVVPVLNPDGLLRPPRMSQRMNANGVDLNRNFPSPDWEEEAHNYWVNRTRRNKRRYPGPAALSEPESAWLAEQIETFKPHAVISVHAPHGVVDFDGPRVPPRQLGPLELRLLGTYPGSMGRYIGVHKGIPLLTVELESAFGMPERDAIYGIWDDMLGWLHAKIARPMQLAEDQRALQPPTDVLRDRGDSDSGG
ncbi:MAG: hypothetical protein HKN49_06535 [Gammaproteobacteria bacterium]|nr:hypothetical protein [Gammaproteobacteria bacterium]